MIWIKKYKFSILTIFILFFVSCGSTSVKEETSKNRETVVDTPLVSPLKTGQDKSYDSEGNLITDGRQKDDGYYQKGEVPHYVRDELNEVVTDVLTGLVWQDNEDVNAQGKPWLTNEKYKECTEEGKSASCSETAGDTAYGYCSTLVLGEYDDWRLPTVKELEGLIDYGKVAPSQSSIFKYRTANDFWSLNDFSTHKEMAWSVDFNDGKIDADNKNFFNSVRCVRK